MSRLRAGWAALATPADLFLAIWQHVNSSAVQRTHLAGAYTTAGAVDDAFEAALSQDDGRDAVAGVVQVLNDYWSDQASEKGRKTRAGVLLGAMRAIDDALLAIHPRTLLSHAALAPPPGWAITARDKRTIAGIYAVSGGRCLVPRGPFARNARGPLETNNFSLADQFAACAVAPLAIEEDGRTIKVAVTVVGQGIARGVPPRLGRSGSEAITLAPLAEATGDLVARVREDGGTFYIDIEQGAGFAPHDIFASMLGDLGDTDVLLLPELVVAPADVDAMCDTLTTASGDRPRLIVCGSGSDANGSHPPWNMSHIINGAGAPLWSHRKLVAYDMLETTFANLEIKDISKAKQLMEQISWSDAITIGDIEGLGRCLVLICQDLMMAGIESLIRAYEPDFLFLPILDSGTNFYRWPYKRLVDLSATGPTRFVVVSSLTMQHWRKNSYPGEQIGVAVGPRHIVAGDASADGERLAQEVVCESASRRYGTVRWRSGVWETVPEPKPK